MMVTQIVRMDMVAGFNGSGGSTDWLAKFDHRLTDRNRHNRDFVTWRNLAIGNDPVGTQRDLFAAAKLPGRNGHVVTWAELNRSGRRWWCGAMRISHAGILWFRLLGQRFIFRAIELRRAPITCQQRYIG